MSKQTKDAVPVATERVETRWVVNPRVRDKSGKPLKESRGAETVREGVCPQHGSLTGLFSGVNAHGWIFRCNGKAAKNWGDDGEPHYFTNCPPKQPSGK